MHSLGSEISTNLKPPKKPALYSANWKAILKMAQGGDATEKSKQPAADAPLATTSGRSAAKEAKRQLAKNNRTTAPIPSKAALGRTEPTLTNGDSSASSAASSRNSALHPPTISAKRRNYKKKNAQKNKAKLAELLSNGSSATATASTTSSATGLPVVFGSHRHLDGSGQQAKSASDRSASQKAQKSCKKRKAENDLDECTVASSAVAPNRERTCSNALKTNLVNGDAAAVDKPKTTKCVALDCEFVGIGEKGEHDMVARVSIVNQTLDCIYDKFVKPFHEVTDYRTEVSGVRPENLGDGAVELKTVQEEVRTILKGRILVGHAVQKDLKVLFLTHPQRLIRDTSKYRPFQETANTYRPALRKLVAAILGFAIQEGEHDSIIDARVCMQLYRLHRKDWEKSLRRRSFSQTKKTKLPKLAKAEEQGESFERKRKVTSEKRFKNKQRNVP